MSTFKIGDPACMGEVVGRINEINGGMLWLKTPHGSIIQASMYSIWIHPLRPGTPKYEMLMEYEEDARAKAKEIQDSEEERSSGGQLCA